MTKQRVVIIVLALIGAVLGAGFGALAAPRSERYTALVNLALTPGPNLTTAESSSFWEVLTRGQISRTAAIVYEDTCWLTSAAKAANVSGAGTLVRFSVVSADMDTATARSNEMFSLTKSHLIPCVANRQA